LCLLLLGVKFFKLLQPAKKPDKTKMEKTEDPKQATTAVEEGGEQITE
jgi:hypothetical protein